MIYESPMYFNIFYQPIFRIGDKVNVAITMFDCDNEEKVRELFYKSYVGVQIFSMSAHYSRESAYKQVYDMGDIVYGHDDFHEPKMMCKKCHQNTISALSDDDMCNFCHFENIQSNT